MVEACQYYVQLILLRSDSQLEPIATVTLEDIASSTPLLYMVAEAQVWSFLALAFQKSIDSEDILIRL